MSHVITAFIPRSKIIAVYEGIKGNHLSKKARIDFYSALQVTQCDSIVSGNGDILSFEYFFLKEASERCTDPHNKLFFIELIGAMRDLGLDDINIEFG